MNINNRFKKVSVSITFGNILGTFKLPERKVLDLGCGYGEYLKLFGKGSVGITTTNEEVVFGKENNLNIKFGNVEKIESLSLDTNFDVIWANNLFEHLLSPHAFLMKIKTISHKDTVIILGVPVVPKIVSLINNKYFRGVLASNHINFFTHTTLKLAVERAGWEVEEVRPFFLKNYYLDLILRPFAPHLYVVAKNNPNFQYAPKKIKEWTTDDMYQPLLKITKQNK